MSWGRTKSKNVENVLVKYSLLWSTLVFKAVSDSVTLTVYLWAAVSMKKTCLTKDDTPFLEADTHDNTSIQSLAVVNLALHENLFLREEINL